MTAVILDGKKVALENNARIKERIQRHLQDGHRAPALAVILVGNDPASSVYVNFKRKISEALGIYSLFYPLPETTSEEDLVSLIETLNHDSTVDGILVQLPLPAHITTSVILEHINVLKDVDGFHPYNLGRLAQNRPELRPCTPYGIMRLLDYYACPVAGKHAVVIGASNIVGRPMALELINAKATVTVCHRSTRDLEPFVRHADIVISGAGHLNVIHPSWLNKNQVVIDVGIHRLDDGTLRGDVDFRAAHTNVGWITPVPGGVGPMTVSMLMENTLQIALNTVNSQGS